MKLLYQSFLLAALAAFTAAAFSADPDTDGDGLSDFAERHKYFTDPGNPDSDGDGKPDGDADERREFTYTVRTVIRAMPPYNVAAMNDDYQDARLLHETAEFGEFEVIHYPLNTVASGIGANASWQHDYASMGEWLKPGITTNWTPAMRVQLLSELRAAGIEPDALTDRALAEKVSKWMNDTCKSLPIYTTAFIEFHNGKPALLPGCEAAYAREKGPYDWTFAEQLEHELFGAGMFRHKTRGSCGSSAIYWTTIFRALGLPARQIFCIPAVDAADGAQLEMVRQGITHHAVRKTMLAGMEPLNGSNAAHAFNEVFIGGRWVRLNGTVLGQNTLDRYAMGLLTHLHTYRDRSEVDAAAAWGIRYALGTRSAEFPTANPYKALEVSDLFGAHAKIANPPPGVEQKHTRLTIDRMFWLRSAEKPDWIGSTGLADFEETSVIAVVRVAEYFRDQNYKQFGPFLKTADPAFKLAAPTNASIDAKILGVSWTNGTECFLALAIPKADYARMKPGLAYALVPANARPGGQWAVQEGVRLTR